MALMPSRWLTKLPAPEPRIAQRMPAARIRSATSATVRKYGAMPVASMIASSCSSRSRAFLAARGRPMPGRADGCAVR